MIQNSSGTRLDWDPILAEAAGIVTSYDTGVTLRQLFYRLVAAQVIPNTRGAYQRLSARTAEARRSGTFPDLVDRGRAIHRRAHWDSPAHALESLARQYRLDRTAEQDTSMYEAVKAREEADVGRLVDAADAAQLAEDFEEEEG